MKKKYGKILVSVAVILVVYVLAFGYFSTRAAADTVGGRGADLRNTYFYSLSGTAPYARFINKQEGAIYDETDTTDYLNATATWINTDVALTTKMTTVGGWLLSIPANLPDGPYDLLIYDVSVAAGARSNADVIKLGKHILIRNGRIVEMSSI